MARMGLAKMAAGPAAIVAFCTLVMYIIIIGIASYYSSKLHKGPLPNANSSSPFLLTWSLPGALIGAAAVFEAFRYMFVHPKARHAAVALNTLAYFFFLLPFGWACQMLRDKGSGSRWKTLAAFCIIVPWFQLALTALLLTGHRRDDEADYGRSKNTAAPPMGTV